MTIDIPPAPVRPDALTRPLERLEAELVELAGQLAGATARFIALIGEFDGAEGWRDWGMKSTAHWLAWKCGLGLVAGRDHVRVARALPGLPLIAGEFAAGRLSFSKVRALTRMATPENEQELIHVARNTTAAQLDRLLAKYRRARRSNNPDSHAKSERLDYHFDDEGFLVGSFRIAPERAPVVGHAFDVLTGRLRELGSEGDEHADPSPGRRPSRADALVRMCEASIDNASAEASPAAAERYQLIVHSSVESLARPDDSADEGPATELQAPSGLTVRLSPATARRLTCDCPASSMVNGLDGSAVHVGRRTRRISRRLRRAVNARDRGMCQTPGCTEPATQIHHIRHWIHGGSTCLRNLISLCDGHHWLVHEGGFMLVPRGSAGWALIGPTGVAVEPTIAPVAAKPLPQDSQIAADAVTGDWAGDRLFAAEVIGPVVPVDDSAEAPSSATVAERTRNRRSEDTIWLDDE
jgi:hypothetical protein